MIHSDAPIDNNGLGQAFSPTDCVANALGSCMITVMAIKANQMGIELKDSRLEIKKHMASDPRRISCIEVDLGIDLDQICLHLASLAGSGPTFFWFGAPCVLNLAPMGAPLSKKEWSIFDFLQFSKLPTNYQTNAPKMPETYKMTPRSGAFGY